MGRATLQTIADRVGVSRATASNAFSRPDQLSASLRATILAAAEELGYTGPDPTARMLARGTTGAVGVLLPESLRHAFTDEVLTAFLGAVADALAPTGLALTLLPPSGAGDAAPARDVPMDGALVCSCEPGSPPVDRLVRRGIPLVLVDQPAAADAAVVHVDDRQGARRAAQHLLDLGHRSVGVLTVGVDDGPRLLTPARAKDAVTGHVARERLRGWLDVLRPAGVRMTVAGQSRAYEDASPAARLLLDVEDPPTAVLCFSDAMAADLVRTAGQLGIRIPTDLSVVGFDDSPLARRLQPALTTVRQDVDAKGRAAAAALQSAIEQSRAGRPGPVPQVVLPAELVVRGTTTPPARSA
ncbi:LacI family DNA-binding transcriptional regulator [Modestobacter marinus]|uniref:LacI family DNA-binding transcriptional regulator n=1 Tax=Modestobacter marinus TaxID=477641 RepID=UPI001C951C4E|nr:LacI family DNA-binding transcriptional regulator [Modestobacter marinus]